MSGVDRYVVLVVAVLTIVGVFICFLGEDRLCMIRG